MALRWLVFALASGLAVAPARPALAQASGGGAEALDAPAPPGAPPAPPPERAAPAPAPTRTEAVPAPPPLDPHPRRGMAGIIVGWSGLGAALASLAMMATCDPLFSRAREAIDTEQSPEVADDVDMAIDDGSRICRAVYGAFAGAAGAVAVLGLPIGYGRRHRHHRRLEQAALPPLRLDLRPTLLGRGGGLLLQGTFR